MADTCFGESMLVFNEEFHIVLFKAIPIGYVTQNNA